MLFGLGGPFCYFLKDQSYYATVELTAERVLETVQRPGIVDG